MYPDVRTLRDDLVKIIYNTGGALYSEYLSSGQLHSHILTKTTQVKHPAEHKQI